MTARFSAPRDGLTSKKTKSYRVRCVSNAEEDPKCGEHAIEHAINVVLLTLREIEPGQFLQERITDALKLDLEPHFKFADSCLITKSCSGRRARHIVRTNLPRDRETWRGVEAACCATVVLSCQSDCAPGRLYLSDRDARWGDSHYAVPALQRRTGAVFQHQAPHLATPSHERHRPCLMFLGVPVLASLSAWSSAPLPLPSSSSRQRTPRNRLAAQPSASSVMTGGGRCAVNQGCVAGRSGG